MYPTGTSSSSTSGTRPSETSEEEQKLEKPEVNSAGYPSTATGPTTSTTTTAPTTSTTTTERVKIYQFNYTALHTPDSRKHGHQEMGFSDSSKMGDYYWDGPDGYRRVITYTADNGGFVPVFRQIPIEA